MKYFFGGLIVVVVLLGAVFQLSRSRDVQVFGELVSRVDTADKVIALTFDDGPVPVFTDKIIAALAAEQVHATFFLMGENIE